MKNYLVILVLLPHLVFAQKIDNMVSYRENGTASLFRFSYDNDYFTATDKNYSQGINMVLASNRLKVNPMNFLLLKPKLNNLVYGLAVEHLVFTPQNIGAAAIQKGDRPYAASIVINSFLVATDTIKESRISSALSLGFIGTTAFGKSMQVSIHESTGNIIPLGWHNQINNDFVVNYEVGYEKKLINFQNMMRLASVSKLNIGTLFTNASIGFNAVVGKINNPFSNTRSNNFQLYFYTLPMVTLVGFDATLQGGFFNKESVYEIPKDHINRVVGQLNFGLILQTKKWYLEYTRTKITREFVTNKSAAWGGIKIGRKF